MGKTLVYNLQSCRMGRRYLVEIIEVAEEKPLGCGGVLMGMLVLSLVFILMLAGNIWKTREEKKKSEAAEKRVEQSSTVAPPVRVKVEYEPKPMPKPAQAILHDGVTTTGEPLVSVEPVKSVEVRPAVISSSASSSTILPPAALQRSVAASAEKEDNIKEKAEAETDTLTNRECRKAARQAKRQAKREARQQNKIQENK